MVTTFVEARFAARLLRACLAPVMAAALVACSQGADGVLPGMVPPAQDAGGDAQSTGDALADAPHDALDATPDADAAADRDGDGTPDSADCLPDDPTRWHMLSYGYRDADGDGYTVASAGTICAGASLPAGYLEYAHSDDCDDADPTAFASVQAYADTDGDGYGAGPAVAQCTGGAPLAGYVANDTDCDAQDVTRWQMLAYAYRDADGDSATVALQGTVCSGAALPPGYANVASGDDCNDHDASVFQRADLYVDTDGDGFGAGPAQSMCIGQTLAGYSQVGGDCAPADGARWQMLAYSYRDADGDGRTRAESAQICAGAALPAGYATQPNGDDCNDADPAVWQSLTVYADTDGDGVGAGSGTLLCNDGTVPAGDSLAGTDCAPADPGAWQELHYAYVDRDGDHQTIAEAGQVCSGASLPPPYFAIATGNDCDDSDAALTRWVPLYRDNDADGAGAGAHAIMCIGAPIPSGFSRYGDDEDDNDPQIGPLPEDELLSILLVVAQ